MHYHNIAAVLIIFIVLFRPIVHNAPFFLQISDKLLFVPLCFGKEHRPCKGTLTVGFLLVSIILFVKIPCLFIQIIEGFMLQPADELLEAVCQMSDLVVVFLIHMNHRRLSLRAASTVVQENHIVSGAWAVADSHTDSGIFPLIDHKLAAQFPAEGIALFPSNTKNSCNGHMIFRPAGRLITGTAGIYRNAAVVLLHQPDVGGGQLVAQFLLHAGDQLIGRRLTDIFFQCIPIIVPEVSKVEVLERGVARHEFFLLVSAVLAFPNLRLAFTDHYCSIFVLWIQLCPPLGVGDSFLFLTVKILISISHPHIPLCLVFSFFSDGLQHLNGAKQSLIPFVVGSVLVVVANNGVIFQCPRQCVGNVVVPPLPRNGI